uniref:ShKT domain-containing protein n=1 Tax=Strongyloides papillosus TaxID=174720 RepID=A0A0N5B8N3_STREA
MINNKLFILLLCFSILKIGLLYNFCALTPVNKAEERKWCGCRNDIPPLGPCVGGECPPGYMCVCDYCCEGCYDDCYDCALYAQYCDNVNYCDLRQKCKSTCNQCKDADYEYPP